MIQKVEGRVFNSRLFKEDEIKLVYSHVDRMVTGSCCPINPISMVSGEIIHTRIFLDRRK